MDMISLFGHSFACIVWQLAMLVRLESRDGRMGWSGSGFFDSPLLNHCMNIRMLARYSGMKKFRLISNTSLIYRLVISYISKVIFSILAVDLAGMRSSLVHISMGLLRNNSVDS